ncbi:MAG: 4-hydroxybenzoate polyprenyltransferase [Pirellulaceae bacterium]|jgi:4-hydroxybenzoate polyprenyltransferase
MSGNSKLLAYLQLFRIPNVFTSISDVAMGYVVVNSATLNWGELACLVAASSLLYTAGMTLNDVYDVDEDTKERPDRPIPSGRISLGTARSLGYGMLVGGVAFGFAAGYIPGGEPEFAWRSGVVATLIAVFVLLYDKVLKKTDAAPVAMGACRFFNVLLGMSTATALQGAGDVGPGAPLALLGFEQYQLLIAGGIGVYIIGVTLFARTEAVTSNRAMLTMATAIMGFGIILLILVNRYYHGSKPLTFNNELTWMLLVLLLAVTIIRRCISAISNPEPRFVQAAIKNCILSLVVLDASLALQFGGQYFGIGVLCLLIPTLLLGRWVYST